MNLAMAAFACGAMAIMFTLLNTHRLWRQARRHEKDEIARWLESEPRPEIERSPRPLDLFAPCPYCGTPAYHLLSAPREHEQREPGRTWTTSFELSVWGSPETVRRVQGRDCVSRPVTVIDRECLSCGKTWMETP